MPVIRRTTIVVPYGSVAEICKITNVRKTTVYAALNYTSNSEIAQKIRKIAMEEFNGVESKKPIFIKH